MHDTEFQPRSGTILATFTQTGTFSNALQLNGHIVGMYSDDFPSAAGSVTFRASWTPAGTGWPVQTNDGTVLRCLSFGSGTFYQFGEPRWPTSALQYTVLQIGTAGTTGVAAGGTIVLVTES